MRPEASKILWRKTRGFQHVLDMLVQAGGLQEASKQLIRTVGKTVCCVSLLWANRRPEVSRPDLWRRSDRMFHMHDVSDEVLMQN